MSTQEYIDNLKDQIQAAKAYGPDSMPMNWLMENVDGYKAEAISCIDCGADNLPVAMVEGGSTPEYACPICFAQRQVQDWEL